MGIVLRDAHYYTTVRDQDIQGNWIKYTGKYLSIMKGISQHKAEAFLKWGTEQQVLNWHDPMVFALMKDERRDRYKTTLRLSQFFGYIKKHELVMAPTLTCYLPLKTRPSKLGKFTLVEFKERKHIKKEGQIAKSYGQIEIYVDKNNRQNKKKELINSISGTLTIGSNPIFNRSGHSTLTSTCRTATAFANAISERLMMGHRHFFDGLSVLENLSVVLTDIDLEACRQVIDKYGLHYVTHAEFMECLKYSYDAYWRSETWEQRIWDFVQKLSPLEMTAYLYVGDLYHLRKYNEQFVLTFIDKVMAFKDCPAGTKEETDAVLGRIDGYFATFVGVMSNDYIGSIGIYDPYHKDKDYYGYIGAYATYAEEILDQYGDYFNLFWSNKFLPSETARFPHAIRRSVLGGDTDSTLFAVLEWTRWYCRMQKVTRQSKLVGNFIIYLYSLAVRHALATTSGQIGVDESHIFLLEMKNEFYFDTFSTSNRTKHYVSTISTCEGVSYKENELEVKGVALKNTKANVSVMDRFSAMLERVLEMASEETPIIAKEIIKDIAVIEAEIFHNIYRGDTDYLPSRSIKVKEAYTLPMSSDYVNYELWEEVFAEKYGHSMEPPYEGVRISMDLPNKTAVELWLNTLEDREIAEKFRQFMEKTGRKGMASIILPYETIAQNGIPDELKGIINVRKIIYANTEPYYILLEMLGIYKINKWLTKMALDDRLEFIEPSLLRFFDVAYNEEVEEIRQATKRLGEEYEAWDNNKDEDEVEFDEEGNLISNEDENNEEEEHG